MRFCYHKGFVKKKWKKGKLTKDQTSWIAARKAQEKLSKAIQKVDFIKYDQNGKICGMVFDE